MLTPEYLAGLPEEMLALWAQVEQQILADMARRIAKYDAWIPSADYQNERLLLAGQTQEAILHELSGILGKSDALLRQMMVDAGARSLESDIAVYRKAGLTVPAYQESKPLLYILNAGYRATAQTMKNLCRTTANTATRQFEDALDRAWLKVSSGAFDYDAAVRSAIKELSESGIAAIRYPSGHTDSIEVAVRRAVITGVNQTSAQLQLELADEVGCDLVEVSAHAGARPEHALWQGQIFSRSGKHPKYKTFVPSTGYGTGAGLGGWNCRHTFGPYIEGSPRVWSDEKLAELNQPKYEYNGQKLTEYEAEQQQRYNERQIRRWKREYTAMEAAGQDTSESAVKIRHWQEVQKDFLRQTDLKRQYGRESVTPFGLAQANRAAAEVKRIEIEANQLFSLGSTNANVKMYLSEKEVIDKLSSYGVKYVRRINGKEIIVDAGHPKITRMRDHALENQQNKPDRSDMDQNKAQTFVDNAKLTLYQTNRETLKFMAEDGYAVLNFDWELVTAVPQKWRNKYNQYIGD